ncbi:MAG: hypothetical protein IPO39_05315 [Bacteroidetes bacterium]|nr:hypothetical protein [Bacteroidota bacterium]
MRAEQYKLFQFLKIVILTFVFLTVIVSQGNAQDTLQGKKFTDYNFSVLRMKPVCFSCNQ